MFWSFNHTSSPHIDILLNKEDVSLHEVMDEEDILQECKVQNKKLIDFLLRPDVMEELVTLTTVEPSGEVDERSRYKYPNIACELLTCDVPALNERLAGDEALLGKLYAFLESDSPLNPLLASFFSKTIGVLVARKSEQVLEFLKSKENCISLLLKHLGTSAIMDLLLKLITHVQGVEMKQNILNWLDSQRVVQCLVGLLDPSVDAERHCNASQLLCDVIRISRENIHSGSERMDPDPILNSLESPETVSQLLDHILGGEKCETSIVGGINVLLTLLSYPKPNDPSGGDSCNVYGGGGQGEETGPGENELPPRVVLSTAGAILPRLKDFHSLLLDPPPKPAVKTTAGLLDPPLGNTRLHVTKLLASLLATNNSEVNKELAHLGTVEVLLDLFFKYTWNNFLHSQVEQCIAFALNSELNPSVRDETRENILLKHIFIKCKLLQRILDAWDDNENQQSKSGGPRRGYMGHLIMIANHIVQHSEKGPLATFIKEHVSADTVAAWEAFVANTLAEINKTHQINLGGANPVQSSSEDDDSTYREISFPQDTALQQVFTGFQMQQISPQFIENYGFHEDEFTDGEDNIHASVDRLSSMTFNFNEDELGRQAELFKQVCAQKLHSLEDNEEDIWEDREQELSFKPDTDSKTRSWQNREEEGGNSSSDEEDRPGPEEREIQMEVDSTDPWANSEVSVAPIAADAVNPWSCSENSNLTVPPATEEGGWADFGSAGFADFEANFGGKDPSESSKESENDGSSPSTKNMANNTANISTSTTVAELAEKLDIVGSSTDKMTQDVDTGPTVDLASKDCRTEVCSTSRSDDNANPSSSRDDQEQLMDNYRFLSDKGLIASGNSSEDMTCVEPELPHKEQTICDSGSSAACVALDNTQSTVVPKPAEASTSESDMTSTPNGPI
ncbi:serine/threonine-protein phosphatase 6 regulatory subunit 3 isoform X2 [Anabrus simplex]|uniref:serine/threonine-protein phosphatase 6 regulatory subunit 3 isoform X2 n=1 Tax=Anabrus simplex TaxID=316456 RepID=UPI0034DDB1AF